MDWIPLVLAYIGGIITVAIPTILTDEYKRWRERQEEKTRELKAKLRNHSTTQILPTLEKWLQVYLSSTRSYGNIRLHAFIDKIPKGDASHECKEHLRGYNEIWSRWSKANDLVSKWNEMGENIQREAEDKIKRILNKEFPELKEYYGQGKVPSKYFSPDRIFMTAIMNPLHQRLRGKRIDLKPHRERDVLRIDGHEVARCDDEEFDKLSSILQNLAQNYESLFPEITSRIKELQAGYNLAKEELQNFKKELELVIKRIKVGDLLKGKCTVCKDWS